MKVEYLVVWKGYPAEKDYTWQSFASLKGCKESVNAFENSWIPPNCVKKGDELCSCGDTGCNGPPQVSSVSCSSWDGVRASSSVGAVAVKQGVLVEEQPVALSPLV